MLNLPGVCGTQLLHPDPAIVLRLLLLAPLLEEWIVRAGLQAWLLQRSPPSAAVLASAAGFGALHLGAGAQAALLVFWPGLLMGLIYQSWRDWRLCAVAHALCNAFALAACNLHLI